ncbi:MAG: hypothetical protein PHS33_07565 [Candidatus Omnitrophica bacterium]|nr:hypothetical protein [Candidatus Omnitrophota bacterium]
MREESDIQKEIASRKNLKPGYLDLLKQLFPIRKPEIEITDIFDGDGSCDE